jgi:hypothetical protein
MEKNIQNICNFCKNVRSRRDFEDPDFHHGCHMLIFSCRIFLACLPGPAGVDSTGRLGLAGLRQVLPEAGAMADHGAGTVRLTSGSAIGGAAVSGGCGDDEGSAYKADPGEDNLPPESQSRIKPARQGRQEQMDPEGVTLALYW